MSTPAAGDAQVVNGELCVKIAKGGANPYDVVVRQRPVAIEAGHRYQVRFKAHATAPARLRAKIAGVSAPYTERWSAIVPLAAEAQTFTGTLDAAAADPNAELVIHLGGELAGAAPVTVCLDDLELNDPRFQIPAERSAGPLPKVRVNQVGYLPDHDKIATWKAQAQQPADWQLVDGAGKTVASGKTRPFGEDKAAGELTQLVDFSAFKAPGKGYKLVVGKDESLPFEVGEDVYKKLKYDALAFFYQQRARGSRSRCRTRAARSGRGRRGHAGDRSVLPAGRECQACSYSLDVSGGWYDAGDHGRIRGQRGHLGVAPPERVRAREEPRASRRTISGTAS